MSTRWKKEEARKRAKAREGLAPEQVVELDLHEAEANLVEDLGRQFHIQLFPEEYDDGPDDWLRDREVNPMSGEYIERVNAKRVAMRILSLSEAGRPTATDSRQICWDFGTAADQEEYEGRN